jgi:hypothetical protein
VIGPGRRIGQEGPADLSIRYVERLPKLDYVENPTDPTTEGWPAEGQRVVWRAHLKNWSDRPLASVIYRWSIDGEAVAEGVLSLGPRQEAALDLPWSWERRRHRIELLVDPDNLYSVAGGPRNLVLLHSDALSVVLYVWQPVYDFFRENQHKLGVGNSSFEDWAHFQVEAYNQLFERAIYPETPTGVLDRLRLDSIQVLPAGATNAFQTRERAYDLYWAYPPSDLQRFANVFSLAANNPFYYDGETLHEMMHVRYMVDQYGFRVIDGTYNAEQNRVDMLENGLKVAGSCYMPGFLVLGGGLNVHQVEYQGLMSTCYRYVDRHTATALNRLAGQRPVPSRFVGYFLTDLPLENRLTLRDAGGRALPGAGVRIFQGVGTHPGNFERHFDATPDLELTTDADGRVLLGPRPFARFPFHSPQSNRPELWVTEGVLIVRVAHGGRVGYGFLEVNDFNLEHWRGHQEVGEYELLVTLR